MWRQTLSRPQTFTATHGDIRTTCERFGFGKTTAYALLRDKKINAKKLGSKTLIEFASVDEFLTSLPSYGEAK